jgi:hypothetical protein
VGRRGAVVSEELIVVVDGGRHQVHRGVVGHHGVEDEVDVAAPAPEGEPALLAEGHLQEDAGVEQADVGVAAHLLRLQLLDLHVDDAARGPAVHRREVARIELDGVEEADGDHAAQAAEVVDEGDLGAVDEDAGVLGRRAAHDEQAVHRRARHAGEVLDHRQRIAAGARHLVDLLGGEHGAAHLLAGALGGDGDVEGIVGAAFDEVGHLHRLARCHRLGGAEGVVAGRLDEHLPLPGRQVEEAEVAGGVGGGLVAERLAALVAEHRHQHARHGQPRAALAQHAEEVGHRGLGWRGRRCRLRFRPWRWRWRWRCLGGELELVPIGELDGDLLSVHLRGLELELLGGGHGGLVEPHPRRICRLGDAHLIHLPLGVDVEQQHHLRLEPLLRRLLGVVGLHELGLLGHLGELARLYLPTRRHAQPLVGLRAGGTETGEDDDEGERAGPPHGVAPSRTIPLRQPTPPRLSRMITKRRAVSLG